MKCAGHIEDDVELYFDHPYQEREKAKKPLAGYAMVSWSRSQDTSIVGQAALPSRDMTPFCMVLGIRAGFCQEIGFETASDMRCLRAGTAGQEAFNHACASQLLAQRSAQPAELLEVGLSKKPRGHLTGGRNLLDRELW